MKEIKSGTPSQLTTQIMALPAISYIPQLNQFTGSVIATILLSRCMDLAEGSNPFFKFIQPCSHPNYKLGDSWCEEIGITKDEFSGAMRKIGIKLCKKMDETDASNAFVWYWTTSNMTWFQVNWYKIYEMLVKIQAQEVTK